jgi:hypothetical protein
MDRDIPTFNQLVVNKINQKNLHLHEQRLQNIRVLFGSSLDLTKLTGIHLVFHECPPEPQGSAARRGQEDLNRKAQPYAFQSDEKNNEQAGSAK